MARTCLRMSTMFSLCQRYLGSVRKLGWAMAALGPARIPRSKGMGVLRGKGSDPSFEGIQVSQARVIGKVTYFITLFPKT